MALFLGALSAFFMGMGQVHASALSREWTSLLHEKDGSSQVQSADFFLTESRDSLAELEQLRQNLASPGGSSWACLFPARTKWVLGNAATLPDFNKCSELVRFRRSFGEVDAVSLVFVSEVPNVPSSAFGHTLLAFHRGPSVTLDSVVVEYAAEVSSNSGFVDYLWRGLSGGFTGVFTRQPLFKKLHTYSKEERRRLFSYQLHLTQEQITYLIDHLYELRDMRFRYYFLTQNCGYQLEKLLEVVKERGTEEPFFYGLPIESLMRRASLAKEGGTIEPIENRARVAVSALTPIERSRFEDHYFKEVPLPSELSPPLRKALSLYAEYDFRSNRTVHPQFSSLSSADFPNEPLTHPNIARLDRALKRGSRRLMLQYSPDYSRKAFWIDFRPVLKDLKEPQLNPYQDSAFIILNPRLRISERRAILESLTLLEITSLPHESEHVRASSWRLYSALDRANPVDQLRFTNEYDFGKTFGVLENLSVGGMLGAGFETSFRMLDGFIAAEAYSYANVSSWMRAGARAKAKFYLSSKYLAWGAFIRGDFIHYGVELETVRENIPADTYFRLGAMIYF